MKRHFLISMIMLGLLLSGCAAASVSETPVHEVPTDYENISVETLKSMMDTRRDSFVLVNTHIPFEGNLPDTDLSIPFTEILDNLDQLPADKDAEIVLYCRSDGMSHLAAADLAEAGYTNVLNLVGGFNAWTEAGYPIELEP